MPVNGKGQDVFTAAADTEYYWIYQKLLQKAIQKFGEDDFKLGCSPFQVAKSIIHPANLFVGYPADISCEYQTIIQLTSLAYTSFHKIKINNLDPDQINLNLSQSILNSITLIGSQSTSN